jgi:hypothetical protein
MGSEQKIEGGRIVAHESSTNDAALIPGDEIVKET